MTKDFLDRMQIQINRRCYIQKCLRQLRLMNGFSLVELMIVLAILISISAVFLPNLFYLKQQNEQYILVNELKNAIQYAKIKSVLGNRSLLLSPTDQLGNWAHGARLTVKVADKEQLLYQWNWNYHHLNLQWHGVHSNQSTIIFNATMNSLSNGKFILTGSHLNRPYLITLNKLGRIRTNA